MKEIITNRKNVGAVYKHTHTSFLKKEKGITLIALVVTIVVLLILAGISLNLVLGNNGIISKAKEAVKKTEEAQLKESLEMEMLESYIDSNSSDDIISMIDANKLKKMGVVGIKKISYQFDDQGRGMLNDNNTKQNIKAERSAKIASLNKNITGETKLAKVEVVRPNKITILAVVEKDGKYYDAEIVSKNENDYSFENIQQTGRLPDEAVIFWKVVNRDNEDIDSLTDNFPVVKYNSKIFNMMKEFDAEDESYSSVSISIYFQTSEPMVIRVNSGTDGNVKIPFASYNNYIDWGDGSTSTVANIKSEKIASINSEIKLAGLSPNSTTHEYSIYNKDYTIYVYGMIFGIDSYDANNIISIEDWGNGAILEYMSFSECTNLKSIASPRAKTFKYVTDFAGAFAGCTSLDSIPDNFFVSGIAPVTTYEGMFYGCTNLKGNAPELWLQVPNGSSNGYQGTPEGLGCFYGCSKLSNYDQIPEYWKSEIEP